MKNFFHTSISKGAILIFAMMFANFAHFVFNAYLGRVLSLEDYAVLAVVNTLWFFITIFMNGLALTTNHFIAFHRGEGSHHLAEHFYGKIKNKSLLVSIIVAVVWILLTPFLSRALSIDDEFAILSVTPAIILGSLLYLRKGYLQGSFLFGFLAVLVMTEAASKLLFAYVLVEFNSKMYVYLSIPAAVIFAFIFAYIFSVAKSKNEIKIPIVSSLVKSPLQFYVNTIVNSIAAIAFLSVDILLVKHFLPAEQAGAYALLSLVGKMIYFLGTLLNTFVISYISRDIGKNKEPETTFYKIFSISIVLTFIAYMFFGYFGYFTIPILLGEKASTILSYIPLYGMGIAAFTLSTTVVAFHLSKKNYLPSYVGLVSTVFLIIGISYFHSSLQDIVNVMAAVSVSHFVVIMVLHMYFLYWKKAPIIEQPKYPILDSLLGKLPIKVSICLPAYNEAKNIGNLLEKLLVQKTKHIHLNKIIVISSASTDKTDEIVREYENKDKRVMLLTESERNGKATAINLFLKHVEDPIVVVQSTDTIPEEDTIENLCMPFLQNEEIGMTGGAPIPVNDRNTFLGYIVHTWWWFHRHIPRFGEIIAFRNILEEISPNTSVDEAYIQAKFLQMGYRLVHVDEAVVHNKGAERLMDMIKQRRRIHNGHLRLSEEEFVKVGHLTKNTVWLLLFKYEIKNIKEFIWLIGGMGIEVIAVALALWDKKVEHKNPVVWDIAKSTKNLVSVVRAKS